MADITEHIEDRLRRVSEHPEALTGGTSFLCRGLFDRIGTGVAIYEARDGGKDFVFVDINPAGEKLSQVDKKDIVGKSILEVFPAVREMGLFDMLRRVWQTGTPERLPLREYRDDRISEWVENSVFKIPTGEVVAIYEDTTTRVQMETSLKEGEKALCLSELKFSAAFRFSPNAMAITDLETAALIDVNEAFLAWTGYSLEEVVGRSAFDLNLWVVPDERRRILRDLSAGEEVFNRDILMRVKGGEIRPVLFSAHFLELESGTCLLTTAVDVTDRKRLEDDLRMSEERFRAIFMKAPIGVAIADTGCRFLEANETLCRMLGYTREEMTTLTVFDIIHPGDRDQLDALSQEVMSGATHGYQAQRRYLRKDGSELWVQVSTAPINRPDGTFICGIGMVEDVTERRRTEQALRDREEELTAIYENAPLIMMLVDDRWKVRKANAFASRLTGKSPGDLTDLMCGEALCCAHALDETEGCGFGSSCGTCAVRLSALDTIATGISRSNVEMDMTISKRGQQREVTFLVFTKRVVVRGESLALLGIQDITRRRQAEKALLERESDLAEAQRLAKIGSWRFDIQTLAVNWTDELYRIFDVDRSEFDGRYDSFLQFVHPDDRPKVLEANKQALDSGEPFDITYRIIKRKNQLKYIREVGYSTRDEQGHIKGLFGTAQDITERVLAGKALVESEARYRSIFDNAVEGIFQSTPGGRFIRVNPAYAHIFGYESPDEMVEAITDIADQIYVHSEDRQQCEALLREKGVVRDFECRCRRKDGTVIWVALNSRVGKTSDGILCYEGFVRDITEQRHLQQVLRESEEKYRSIFDHSKDAILLTSPDGSILEANRAACEMFGRSVKEIRQIGRKGLVDATDPRLQKALRKRALAGGTTAEFSMLRANGDIFPAEVMSTVFLDANGQQRTSMIIRDVSERRRAEKALKERDVRFRKLSQHVPGMIYQFLKRADGTYCSPFTTEAVYKLFGCTPEDVREDFSPIARVVLSEDLDKLIHSIEYSAEHMTDWQCEYRVQVPGEPVKWMFGQATPERQPDGTILWHGFNMDITDRRRIMEELIQSREEMRALAGRLRDVREEERKRIARAIHDEMGQALTGIKMDLGWVKRQLSEKPELDRPKIASRLESMGDLADVTIREMRRIITELRPGVLDDLGLVAALEWLAQDFRSRTGGECVYEPPEEEIEVDPDRAVTIFRIAQEAMTNIIRHSGAKKVVMTLQFEDGNLLFQVSDDGRGFSEEEAQKRGAFGLLGMRERALAIGGTVEIRSKPGTGTTVSIRVPLAPPERKEVRS